MEKTEINIPFMAEIDGKAIPTQGIIIKVPANTNIRLSHNNYGSTEVLINSPEPELPIAPPETPTKAGYLSGVPLPIDNIDMVDVKPPSMGSRVNG